jgi:hypothetical protein
MTALSTNSLGLARASCQRLLAKNEISVLRHRSISPELEAERERVTAGVRARTSPLMMVHIQKAGGTTVCKISRMSDRRDPGHVPPTSRYHNIDNKGLFGKNCNPWGRASNAAWYGTPEEMISYTRETVVGGGGNKKLTKGIEVYFHEWPLPKDLAWGTIAYATILRDPASRTLSHWKHFEGSKDIDTFLSTYEDNYMVRRLCGGCMALDHDPRGGCAACAKSGTCTRMAGKKLGNVRYWTQPHNMTEEHLACAKNRLERFSAVWTLDIDGAGTFFLGHALNFTKPSTDEYRTNVSKAKKAVEISDAQTAALDKLNNLDRQLFQHARELACGDIENYFQASK